MILAEFGLNSKSGHITNGHIPVKAAKGENQGKAGGRRIAIDGKFCRAYHQKTGIAGQEKAALMDDLRRLIAAFRSGAVREDAESAAQNCAAR